MLTVLVAACLLLLAGALAAALFLRSDRLALAVGSATSLAACAAGLPAAVISLARGERASARVPWPLPIGEIHLGVDPLSAFFLLCIFLVSGLAALYGRAYLKAHAGGRPLAPAAAAFNLLVAAMAGTVLARDGVLFLVAWETMTIASYLLVTHEHEREEVRRAGMTYLIASQLGAVCLLVLFVVLARGPGGFDFDSLAAGGAPAALADVCFLLALLGFGAKAGLWPVHVWLPEAHPAAPSHVSAVMSGVMIKIGIYGLLRVAGFLGPPPPWWGALLVVIGTITGVAGILHALAQRDLKRLLAYSSVENIGIVALGLGIGLLGASHGQPVLAGLGYAGALLHVLNHGIFKGLLFQAAGSVAHAAGTRDLEALGGLQRRMPGTGLAFLAGAVAVCALPPLNGLIGEWFIFRAAFRAGADLPYGWAAVALVAVPALALIGGMAAACFLKAYGIAFLGAPRTAAAAGVREAPAAMRLPMMLGAVLCLGIGLWPEGVLGLVAPAVSMLPGAGALSASGWPSGTVPGPGEAAVALEAGPLAALARAALLPVAFALLLAAARAALLRRRAARREATWACGFAPVTPRMQYTASSFADPLIRPFARAIHLSVRADGPDGLFPAGARYEERIGDVAGERLLVPASRRFVGAIGRLRILQHGRIQLYLVYVAATLVVLLVWQLAGGR